MATPSEEDRATTARNMHRKFGKVHSCGFRVKSADRQTDRKTNILITILRTPPRGEVKWGDFVRYTCGTWEGWWPLSPSTFCS